MFNMIKADAYKLSKNPTVKISILVSCLCALVVAYILHGVYEGVYSLNASSAFALVSDTMILPILGSVLIGILICGSFESKNIHDEILSGNGRFAIIITKTLSVSLIIILLTLPYVIITITGVLAQIGFGIYLGVPSAFFNILSNIKSVGLNDESLLKSIILSMLITFSYIAKLSICIPVAFKTRKTIAVILAGFVTTIVFDIISELTRDMEGINNFVEYLPYRMTYKLTLDCSSEIMLQSAVSSILFIGIMLAITGRIFRKAEIK